MGIVSVGYNLLEKCRTFVGMTLMTPLGLKRRQLSLLAMGFLGLLVALQACQEAEPDLLPQELMREVLVELHVADAYTETQSSPVTYRNALREDLYLEILEKFELEEETFRHTYEYYTSHPNLMDSLYQEVIIQLEQQLEGERALHLKEIGELPQEDEAPPEEAPARAPWQNPDGLSQ